MYMELTLQVKEDNGKEISYRCVPFMEGHVIEEPLSQIQTTPSENAIDKTKVRVVIEGDERVPLKVLRRTSDGYGRFSLGKGDECVTNKDLLVIVLEPRDPNDRIFMEPTRRRKTQI
mgnify:CR=1 FL=1